MTVTEQSREQLLEQYGRWYGEERLAVAFTATIDGEAAKRVTTPGWDTTAPLTNGDYAAALIANRGLTRNPAIVLRPSNLVVLECDSEQDLVRIQELHLPETITVRSSKPYKRHYWFRPPHELEALPYVAFRFESGNLTADAGRYFLAPPSIHPSGQIYAFLPDLGPDDVDIAELPEHAYRELAQESHTNEDELREHLHVDPDAKVPEGKRRESIFRFACAMRRWTASAGEILEAAQRWNLSHCDPPVTREQVEMQVDGAMKKRGEQDLARAIGEPAAEYDDPGPEWEQPGVPVYLVDSPPEPPGATHWQRADLANPENEVPPEPPVVRGLLYAAKRHVLSGPPESAKTLIAYALLLYAQRDGHPVAIIDFEMGQKAANLLLRDLGATRDEIRAVYYVEPDQAPLQQDLQDVIGHGTRFALIDASAGAYDVTGLDDNSRKDAEAFARQWIRPLWQAGVSTLLLDHVTKNADTRGKFTIGSERKTGQADIHLGFEALKALSRGASGMVKVHVHKDRPGFLARPTAAMFDLTSAPDTNQVTYQIREALPTDEGGSFQYTIYMERVSRELQTQTEPVSLNHIELAVKGNAKYKREALEQLVRDGYVAETTGPRRARLFSLVKPYTKPSDDFVPTSSPLRPDEDTTTSSHFVPPLQGDEVTGRGQSDEETRSTSSRNIDVHDPAVQAMLNDEPAAPYTDPDFPPPKGAP